MYHPVDHSIQYCHEYAWGDVGSKKDTKKRVLRTRITLLTICLLEDAVMKPNLSASQGTLQLCTMSYNTNTRALKALSNPFKLCTRCLLLKEEYIDHNPKRKEPACLTAAAKAVKLLMATGVVRCKPDKPHQDTQNQKLHKQDACSTATLTGRD